MALIDSDKVNICFTDHFAPNKWVRFEEYSSLSVLIPINTSVSNYFKLKDGVTYFQIRTHIDTLFSILSESKIIAIYYKKESETKTTHGKNVHLLFVVFVSGNVHEYCIHDSDMDNENTQLRLVIKHLKKEYITESEYDDYLPPYPNDLFTNNTDLHH